jgi:capsular polysaccharide biosynthesis protein
MDLADLLEVMFRRWWLIVGLPAAVAVLSWAGSGHRPVTYEARLRFAVDIPKSALVAGSDEGSAAKVGEALIDDVARMLPSAAFAQAVSRRLPADVRVAPGELASELSATDRHRVADVWVRRAAAPDASSEQLAALQGQLAAIGQAAVAELEENGNKWFARLGEDSVSLTVIDGPTVSEVPPTLRQRLDLPLRIALALVVAVGLAFLLHALDPALYTEDEVRETTGATVLARIPAARARRRD